MRYPWWTLKVWTGLFLVGVAAWGLLADGLPHPLQLAAAQVTVIVGVWINMGHYLILKRANHRVAEPEELVRTGGWFPRIRHPMYLGDLVVASGLVVLSPHAVTGGLWAVIVAAVVQQCRVEDAELATAFGKEFEAWREQSGAIWPG